MNKREVFKFTSHESYFQAEAETHFFYDDRENLTLAVKKIKDKIFDVTEEENYRRINAYWIIFDLSGNTVEVEYQ